MYEDIITKIGPENLYPNKICNIDILNKMPSSLSKWVATLENPSVSKLINIFDLHLYSFQWIFVKIYDLMGHPSGEKQSTDYPEELIAARAEMAFKVRSRLIFQLKTFL